MDTPLSRWEQLIQNVGIGPHWPTFPPPPVCAVFWTEHDWARYVGVDVETWRRLQKS